MTLVGLVELKMTNHRHCVMTLTVQTAGYWRYLLTLRIPRTPCDTVERLLKSMQGTLQAHYSVHV